MTFTDAAAYDLFMGRFSEPLAGELLAFAGVGELDRVLDVGCGPGGLTHALVERWGTGSVSAVDPSPPFVKAARARFPGVEIQQATAEALPFGDGTFDLALAQLVVHFMADPVAGLREMARVTTPGGTVAACVWDHADQGGPLGSFWAAVRELDPDAEDESDLAGAHEGDLARLAAAAGWSEVSTGIVAVSVDFAAFEQWWHPFTLGVGPAGAYVRSLDEAGLDRLHDRCAARFPDGPFTVRASAWAVRGVSG